MIKKDGKHCEHEEIRKIIVCHSNNQCPDKKSGGGICIWVCTRDSDNGECTHDTRQHNVPEGSDCDKCIHNVPARVRTEFRKCDITDHLIGYDYAFVEHMNAVGCRSFEVSQ